jgi:predicted extracellular nuclease
MIRRLAAPLVTVAALLCAGTAVAQTSPFINEIHYDNAGTDAGEAVEIAGVAGTDLGGWTLQPYNGANGAPYSATSLSGVLPNLDGGNGTLSFPILGLQNGAPDGIALVRSDGVVTQFLSYEGSFTAVGGPADGLSSTDIGVQEDSSTPAGSSLQLVGTGSNYEDFTWSGPSPDSFGAVNDGQDFDGSTAPPTTIFVNEIHYDNAGGDVDEGVEIAGPAGTDLSEWTLQPYNGANGLAYSATPLSGVIADQCNGFGTINFSVLGLQNGAPDGVALVQPDGTIAQFLSYEGAFSAVDGPAAGQASIDIGVSESGSTAIGDSMQLQGSGSTYEDFSWAADVSHTRDAVNVGQDFNGPCSVIPDLVKIYDVQGSGRESPLAGQTVRIQGVVVGDFQDANGVHGDLNGFFVQEQTGDGDSATSDGIFIFEPASALDVMPGDLVEVTGPVSEFFGETQISASAVSVLGSGSVAPTPVTLPSAGVVDNADGRRIADLEQFEGMLVSFPQTLTVTELFNLDRFGELRLAEGGRLFQYTQVSPPDIGGFPVYVDEIASRNVMLDDGLITQNPDPIRYPPPGLDSDNPVRMGDTVTGLQAVITYRRGSGGFGDALYRTMPVQEPVFVTGNTRPVRPEVGGSLKVASINVLNYFTTIDDGGNNCFPGVRCRGADSQEEFDRQREKLVTALVELDADVVGLVELENNFPDGTASAIADLVAGLNAVASSTWDWVDPGTNVGDDAIAVGLIYKTDTVRLAPDTTPAILTDADLPGLGLTAPIFDGMSTNRAPLAATFEEPATGGVFTVAVNHYKSKGASELDNPGTECGVDIDPATEPNCDQGDGQSFWNARRTQASEAVAAWLATGPTGSDDADIMIVGDLNAYVQEDPISFLKGMGYQNLTSDPATYTFVFDGQAGTLDYALVTPDLADQVTGVAEWHINADEADGLDYNLDFGRNPAIFDGTIPFRSSDHDPVIVGLNLESEAGPIPADLLAFYDAAVDAGELTGKTGPYRNQLVKAVRHYEDGEIDDLCVALRNAYLRADGTGKPPKDFIDGSARTELLALIDEVAAEYGCSLH